MTWIISIMKWLFSSFDNTSTGASGRKLSAFILMMCVVYLHINYVDKTNAIDFLISDLSAVGVLLGIVTVQNIIDLKTQKKNP